MPDEGIELIEQKVQQAIALIEKLRQKNENLKQDMAGLQNEIQRLKEEASTMQDERTVLRGKIDSAVSMLDKIDLDDVLESMAEEVAKETEAVAGEGNEDDS